MTNRLVTLCAVALLALAAARAGACNVPVFRYAMEMWPADAYAVVIFHRGALSAAQRAAVDAIEKSQANTEVALVDLADTAVGDDMKQLWARATQDAGGRKPELPCVVAKYPTAKWDKLAWRAALDAAAIGRLLDSPLRQEISQRLIRGDAAVWVMVESGDKAADDAAEKMLTATLTAHQKQWTPPATQPDDPPMETGVPTEIKFSTVRLSRADKAEQVFVGMLLGLGESFEKAKGPVVFPIFGRGRVLAGLTGGELTANIVNQAADFITGACSCEVKSQNPGIDLLIATDWTTLAATRPSSIGGLPSPAALSAIEDRSYPSAVLSSTRSVWTVWRNAIVASAVALAAVVVGSILVLRRRSGGGNP